MSNNNSVDTHTNTNTDDTTSTKVFDPQFISIADLFQIPVDPEPPPNYHIYIYLLYVQLAVTSLIFYKILFNLSIRFAKYQSSFEINIQKNSNVSEMQLYVQIIFPSRFISFFSLLLSLLLSPTMCVPLVAVSSSCVPRHSHSLRLRGAPRPALVHVSCTLDGALASSNHAKPSWQT
jgi:hypothetical protein